MKHTLESSPLQPLSLPILAEEERRRWFQGARWSVPSAARWNGGGVPYYTAEHVIEELEHQVVLHEAEPPGCPLRHRPYPKEPEELVGDAKQR